MAPSHARFRYGIRQVLAAAARQHPITPVGARAGTLLASPCLGPLVIQTSTLPADSVRGGGGSPLAPPWSTPLPPPSQWPCAPARGQRAAAPRCRPCALRDAGNRGLLAHGRRATRAPARRPEGHARVRGGAGHARRGHAPGVPTAGAAGGARPSPPRCGRCRPVGGDWRRPQRRGGTRPGLSLYPSPSPAAALTLRGSDPPLTFFRCLCFPRPFPPPLPTPSRLGSPTPSRPHPPTPSRRCSPPPRHPPSPPE